MARLSLLEAADKIGVSTRTLRRRIREGRLHADLEDGKYFISPTELDRFGQEDRLDTAKFIPKSTRMAAPTETVTLTKTEYDSLIYKLATLESELGQARNLLDPPAKSTWWRRLWSK